MMALVERALRVAQVVRPASGGIRRHVTTLLMGLPETGVLQTLFAPEEFSPDRPGVAVSRVALAIHPRIDPVADLAAMHRLARALRCRFDLAHAHGVRAAWIAGPAARRAGVPFVATLHNLLPPLGAAQRLLLRYALRDARVIAVSDAVAESAHALRLAPGRLKVLPNGIDLAPYASPFDADTARAAFGLGAGGPLVVAVGRLAREKGFDTLIRAMGAVQARLPDARLVLAGSGPEEEALRGLASSLRTPSGCPAVIFTGFVPDVVPILRIGDVVAVPSRQEGQGIVALEAMAASRPVVASRVGGLRESVLHDESGLLTAPDDPVALGSALTRLLERPALAARMGAVGRQRVERDYTQELMLSRLTALYWQTAHRRDEKRIA